MWCLPAPRRTRHPEEEQTGDVAYVALRGLSTGRICGPGSQDLRAVLNQGVPVLG